MVEFESHLINEEKVKCSDFYFGPGGTFAQDYVFKGSPILVSTQVFLHRRFYLRPGVGISTDNFAYPVYNKDGMCADVKLDGKEAFALGFSLGYESQIMRHFVLALEAVGRFSTKWFKRRLLGIPVWDRCISSPAALGKMAMWSHSLVNSETSC